jgi:hypothetical protein
MCIPHDHQSARTRTPSEQPVGAIRQPIQMESTRYRYQRHDDENIDGRRWQRPHRQAIDRHQHEADEQPDRPKPTL